jgi:hypothetical protein
MELKDILAISGRPGLWNVNTTTRTAIVVESLDDDSRTAIPATQRVSSLGEISIFTYEDDIPLGDVFNLIHEKANGGAAPHAKEPHETLRSFVTDALPNLDQDRVYHSDLKKLCTWYNAMLALGVLPIVDTDTKVDADAVAKDEVEVEVEVAKDEAKDS